MFERIFKAHIATVSDVQRRSRIVDALAAEGIPCSCKTKDVNRRNAFDQGKTGALGIRPKYVTEIFVDKKNAEMALHIVRDV